jgi:hypothetical protein
MVIYSCVSVTNIETPPNEQDIPHSQTVRTREDRNVRNQEKVRRQ